MGKKLIKTFYKNENIDTSYGNIYDNIYLNWKMIFLIKINLILNIKKYI